MERFHNTFSVCFYCRETKVNKEGLAPVEMGINYQGERFFINTSIRYKPLLFKKETSGKSVTNLRKALILMEQRVRGYESECLADGEAITIQGIKDYIRNGYQRPGKTVKAMFDGFFTQLSKKLDNGNIIQSVFNKYARVRDLFYEQTGIDRRKPATSITVGMVNEFCDWIDATYKNSTSVGMKTKLKTIMTYGRDNGYMKINPFQQKILKKEVQIIPLDEEELDRIMTKDLSSLPRLERVRDLFIFSCFTGLAYCDTQKLEPEDISEQDGTYYINKERAKTGVKFMVVLLPEALAILKKYDWRLPRISNQRLNSYLFELETLCRIDKHLHFHLSRHTCECMFLNKYGFKTEVTAKILGHKSIKISQHYQKMFNNTVFQAFQDIK